MMRKRGQASFEFLTTYGWAFMVILIMMGALSYFGILNPSKFLPERCTFPQDFVCNDYQLNGESGWANLQLRHNMGETIVVENVTCEFDNQEAVTNTSVSGEWKPKETLEVGCNSNTISNPSEVLISGQKEKVLVEIAYRLEPSGYAHYAEGEVYANVI